MNMGSISAVRDRILECIRLDPTAIPGRAGETPLSNLAVEFKRSSTEDVVVATEACAQIIEDAQNIRTGASMDEFWFGITFLTQCLPQERRRKFIEPYREHLLGHLHLEWEGRVRTLLGFITSGGVLTEQELLVDLADIREQAPTLWVDAAVYSGLFAFAEQQLRQLFHESALSAPKEVQRLCVVLHSWQKRWPDGASFVAMVREFPQLTDDKEVRDRLAKWVQSYIV